MSKYYTPQKEEFHIGFEYEVKSKGKWIKTIFNDGRSAEQYTDMEIPVRVKKLDKGDIEGLGWKEFIYETGIPKAFKMKVTDNDGSFFCQLTIDLEGKLSIANMNKVVFVGFIRNKSELRFEMKKLNLL